ncbi:phosphate ABC transporter substrate-binding protein PstS [Kocuria turfanensis]|uniref:Phosphate-binding protein n=1 Tax=Kocuria turfanensis TaxID=388357 RepID=A0A512IC55_9MICC|nr:phosphate ABC transporter substrate-binding protein PstS [Kocuria turfanensis]GEO95288.1 phosphate-binding protein PstS [Kocuria turfanensis]
MKASHLGRSAAVLAIGTLALTACGSDNATGGATGSGESSAAGAGVSGTLTGIGASSQQAAMTAWQNGFQEANPEAQVQYSPDGSGAGREAFTAGGADFAGTDAYLDEEEYEASKEVCGPDGGFHVPAYISPIAVAFNLPGVDTVNMDGETIAQVFTGEISTWNDPAIAEQNPDADLPDTPITVVHRNDESGTTENFQEYLAAAAPEVWTEEVSGNWPSQWAAENNKGTAGVVQSTGATEGAITYADASAVGDLGTVAVGVGEEYVPYSAEAASAAVESSTPVEGRAEYDMAMDLERDTTASGAYPIVLVSYHLYCSQYDSQETADLAKAFGSYVISEEGQQAAADAAGSAPMSENLRTSAQEAIDQITVAG